MPFPGGNQGNRDPMMPGKASSCGHQDNWEAEVPAENKCVIEVLQCKHFRLQNAYLMWCKHISLQNAHFMWSILNPFIIRADLTKSHGVTSSCLEMKAI